MLKFIVLVLPVFIYAEGLKSLLDYAHQNNQLVSSKELTQQSKLREVDSKKSAYYPTVDVGGFYQNLNEKTTGLAGDTYSGFAKVGVDLYDGGSKSALLKQKRDEYKASSHDVSDMKKSISLSVMQNFFGIKSLEATLSSREEAHKSLKAQLDRMNAFYDAALATKDDVDRLQAAYDTNVYEMESVKLQILSSKLNLSLQVGKKITSLDKSSFNENIENNLEVMDAIQSLEYSKQALHNYSESIDSAYYPQIRLEDTYSLYSYSDTDTFHPKGVDNQNKLMVSLNLRLYDNATLKSSKQAVAISSQALSAQIEYKTLEQEMLHELALARINTNKIKIKSALSALEAAKSAFHTIEQKYTAGIVDNVAYLDALTSKTSAMSLYETSLNDAQIAYGQYYYYAGKNLEEFIND
ncbi:MAG: outer membrane protein [Sulfurimonas sp.]|jgi:outer membrane protein|uniref:TolC family protein n=1 Tax=Sulfurimonas sp. TaxID=2022749 RepID=UPI0039E2E450